MTACMVTATLFSSTLAGCSSDNSTDEDTSSKDAQQDEPIKSETVSANVGSGLAEKDETVYAITDKSGKTTEITVSEWLKNRGYFESLEDTTNLSNIVNVKGNEDFIITGDNITFAAKGSDIYYQGNMDASTQLPVELKITYKLDGKEVSAKDVVGKSGKLTMTVQYCANEKTEKDIYVPFVAASGILLSTDKCTNVEVENGKIISNGNYNIIVGVGLPGLSDSLGLEGENRKQIPDTVEITADVTDFDIDMMMTFVSNEMFSNLNLDDITDLSDLEEQIKTLCDSSIQLREGIKTLREGIEALKNGSDALQDGVTQLDDGAAALAKGLDSALSGSGQLVSGSSELEQGLEQLMSAFTKDNGAIDGINQLDSGAAALKAGVTQLSNGLNNTFSQISQAQAGAKSSYANYMKSTGLSSANVESNTEIQAQLTKYIGAYAQRCLAINNQILTTNQETVKAQKTEEALAANQTLIASIRQQVITENQADVTAKVQAQIMEDNADYINEIKQRIATEYMTNYPGQDVSDLIAQAVQTEIGAAYGNIITEQVTEELTAMTEAKVTEALTEEITNAVTDELTNQVTNAIYSDATLADYSDKIGALVQAAGQKGAYTALKTISDGAAAQDLSGNLSKLVSGAGQLADGAAKFRIALGNENSTSTDTIFGALYNLRQGSSQLYNGMVSLDQGVSQLEAGSNTLADGTSTLKSKVPTLLSGMEQLLSGSKTLEDGMNKFDEEGIQKIADFYNGDVTEFIENIKAIADASKEYNTFTKLAENQTGTVKFIITTK